MKLKTRIKDIDNDKVEFVSKKYALPKEIATLLLSRTNSEDIDSYIYPDIKSLFSPFLITNMQKVVDKIRYIKDTGKHILIYGDYDVDGITATSLLTLFFRDIGVRSDYYIPSRSNGYGLSVKSIDEVLSEFNPDLIITVDCGITSVEEVEYIKSKGIDIVITDHHTPQSILPDCIIINPHLENLKFRDLCGCGVAFKIIEAYYNLDKDMYIKYLPIVAIGTVADVVPLKSDNRIMVQLGLSVQSMLPKGIKTLISMLSLKDNKLTSHTIAFNLAPVLNSAGRLKNAGLAVKIFVSDDDDELIRLCTEIIMTNKERQQITETIFSQAESQIVGKIPSAIVLKSSNWDAGVIGIVASKIMDKYKKTTILFTESNGVLKGSCRSVDGINIFNELDKVKDYLVQFGGHEKAAGLTVSMDSYDEFKKHIVANIHESMKDVEATTYYDLSIDYSRIDSDFAKKLRILEPFGECNPCPVFLLKMNSPEIEFMKNPKHISLKFHSIKVKYFYVDKQLMNYSDFVDSDNLVEISYSTFGNILGPDITCCNAIFHNLSDRAITKENKRYLAVKGNIGENNYIISNIEDVKEKSNFIICTYNYNNYKKLEKIFGDKVTYTSGSVMMAEKKRNICYCLENIKEVNNFEYVYFTEESMASCISAKDKILIEGFEDFKISTDRQKVVTTFLALDRFSQVRPISVDGKNIIEDFDAEMMHSNFGLLYSNFNLPLNDFLYSLLILEDIGIISYDNNSLVIDKQKKCDLGLSRFFNI